MTAAPLRLPVTPASPALHESVERFFEAMLAAEGSDVPSAGAVPTPGETAQHAIALAWPHARVISFDIFDTLVVRKVAAPRDVFLQLAAVAPFSAWAMDAVALADQRQHAEDVARRAGVAARKSAEVTLHEIHAELAKALGRPATDVDAMVDAERLVERALCVAHPYLRTLFERARREGKTIWCVSDTYHDADFLRTLLVSCGYAMDGVLVVSSADRRMSKGEGKLLKHVATEQDVAPSRVLHIGDNGRADFGIPSLQGFLAVLHPWAAARHDDAPAALPGDAIALGLSQIGSRTVVPAFPFWWRFGYGVAGPMLASFAIWLHDRFVADGIDRAYFLLRDGEIIHEVYRALLGDKALTRTSLLESSRRAFVLPALEAGRSAITSQLMACENPTPVREFLERFGVKTRELESAFRAVGFASGDDVIVPTDVVGGEKLRALLSRPDVVTALVERSRAERALLLKYLQQEKVLAPGTIALVDIGWSGTIQKALMAVGALEKKSLNVHGYYLGTLGPIVQDLGGSEASGFFFDKGAPADRAQPVLDLRQLVEFICTTTRGSLRSFRLEGNRAVPVHGPVDHPEAQREAHAQLKSGAMAFVQGLAAERTVFGAHPISPDAGLRHFARTVLEPTAEEAMEIGNIRHGDGLGADRLRAFAAFGDAPITRQSLFADYQRAYWKKGLLARREPAALALRSLLWLRER